MGTFTLIELLVVIAIIAILAALLLPALKKAKEATYAVVCKGNQRQLVLWFFNYAADYGEVLPHNSYAASGCPEGYTESAGAGMWYAKCELYNADVGRTSGIFLCPQARLTIRPRGEGASHDYSMNGFFGNKSSITGHVNALPRLTRLKPTHLVFGDARIQEYLGAMITIRDLNMYYRSEWGYGRYCPWMWQKNGTGLVLGVVGRGHPGNTASLALGDGHVEGIGDSPLQDRYASTTKFQELFSGYKQY